MDASRSSHSSSSQHYSSLLNTVSELRTDLERTMIKIHSLESQNQTLSNNYQSVKDQLIETKVKYNEIKETYVQSVQEKFELEEKYVSVINNVQSQLAEKTREFEIVRDKLVPHDIDQLRIKVQEELEIQHKQQLQAVERELAHQRDLYYVARREAERSKAESDIIAQHLQHEIIACRAEREEVEASLRAEVARLQDLEFVSGHVRLHPDGAVEKAPISKPKELELGYVADGLRKDLLAVRDERDELITALEKTRSEHEIATTQLRAQLAINEAERRGLEEQLLRANIESDRRESKANDYRSSAEDMHERAGKLHRDVQRLEKAQCTLREDHARQIEAMTAAHESERHELQEALEAAADKLKEREGVLRRAQRDATDMQMRAESVEVELRRNHQLQMQDLRKKLAQREAQLADAENTIKASGSQANSALEHSVFELNGLRSDLARVRREKDILQGRLRELEALSDSDKTRFASLQKETAAKISALEARARESETLVRELESRLRESKDRQLESQGHAQAAKELVTQLERRVAELTAQLEATKAEFKAQIDLLTPSYLEQFESMKSKLNSALLKEHKRAEAYKSKALEAHSRVKAISSQSGILNDR